MNLQHELIYLRLDCVYCSMFFSLPTQIFEFCFDCEFFPGAICVAVFHIAWIHVKMETITVQTVEHSLELMYLKHSFLLKSRRNLLLLMRIKKNIIGVSAQSIPIKFLIVC